MSDRKELEHQAKLHQQLADKYTHLARVANGAPIRKKFVSRARKHAIKVLKATHLLARLA